MAATQRSHFTAAAAALGVCLIVAPAVVAPGVPQHAVELSAAGNPVDLASSSIPVVGDLDAGDVAAVIDALTSGGVAESSFGDMGADELPDLGDLFSVTAGAAEADPFGDLWQQIYDAVMPVIGPIILFAPLFFFGLVANVAQFFTDAYVWVADLFGFDPFPEAAVAGVSEFVAPVEDLLATPDLVDVTDIGTLLGLDLIPDLGI